MTDGLLSAFASVWLGYALGTLIPGPNVMSVAASALLGGWRQGLGAAAGIALATVGWSLGGVLGLGALLAARPDALWAMQVAGALALCWLGFRTLREDSSLTDRTGSGSGFARGLTAAVSNPINALLWTSLAGLVIRVGPQPHEVALYVLSCALLAFCIHGGIALTISALPARPSPGAGGIARALCGGAFFFLGGILVGG